MTPLALADEFADLLKDHSEVNSDDIAELYEIHHSIEAVIGLLFVQNATTVLTALRESGEAAEIRKLLPDEMPGCKIVFKECEIGHGRLTATNWIDHGCPHCLNSKLELELRESGEAIELRRENEQLKRHLDEANHWREVLSNDLVAMSRLIPDRTTR